MAQGEGLGRMVRHLYLLGGPRSHEGIQVEVHIQSPADRSGL